MARMVYTPVLVITLLLSLLLVCPHQGLGETPTPALQGDTLGPTTPPPLRTELERLIAAGRLAIPDSKAIIYPAGVPPSATEVALGKALFFERQLSQSQQMSCATCHNPTQGFSDGRPRSIADRGHIVPRNASGLSNLAWHRVLFWDGRETNLETLVLDVIKSPNAMDLPPQTMVERLKAMPYYAEAFKQLSPPGLSAEQIGKALGAFVRSLITHHTAFDRYLRGDETALSARALQGLRLFVGKANCLACHDGANFTDESFHNIGLVTDDLGRGQFESGGHFQHAFKTPGLRNVALTAPYMHNGSLNTLREVVQFYNQGGQRQEGIDLQIQPLQLTAEEMDALVAFMESLTEPIPVPPLTMPVATQERPPAVSAALSGQFRFLAAPPDVGLLYFPEDRTLRQALTIDQQGKAFLQVDSSGEKRLSKIIAGSPGESIRFKNSASIAHNVYASDKRLQVQFDLGLAPPGSTFTETYPISWPVGEVLRIGCKIHPGMQLHVASLTSRYYKELEFNGAQVWDFALTTLPAPLTTIVIWLPEYERLEVSLKLGAQQDVPLKKHGQLQGMVTLKRQ